MKSSRKGLVCFLAILPLAGTAVALDSSHVASNDPAMIARSAVAEHAVDDRRMEAACREVMVDTDEGYGVSNHESRFVCDNNQ